ncbi:MAG: bacteriohemerythrin [Actinomycetota bacterium]
MPLIEWNDGFSVGSTLLDADHRRLIDIHNRMVALGQGSSEAAALGALFDELLAFAEGHFAREETILKALGYEGLGRQKALHVEMGTEILRFRGLHMAGCASPASAKEATAFLRGWLIHHILEEDMQYRSLMLGE